VVFSLGTLVFTEIGDTILHFAMNSTVIPTYLLEISYFYCCPKDVGISTGSLVMLELLALAND
jgi:hypothetical protein